MHDRIFRLLSYRGGTLQLASSATTLVRGAHPASLDEVHDLFVDKAPFKDKRELIFSALVLWISQLKISLPATTTLWLDGGFVTHKPWAAPADVDVVAIVDRGEFNDLVGHHPGQFCELFTQFVDTTHKVHPMGGLVDAFPSRSRSLRSRRSAGSTFGCRSLTNTKMSCQTSTKATWRSRCERPAVQQRS